MHIINNLMKFLRLNLFSTTKCYIQIYIKNIKYMKKIRTEVKGKCLNLISTQKIRQNYVIQK